MRKTIHLLLSSLVVALLYGCADDSVFTASKTGQLSFSTDTLKLDTVFSNVPSSARSMWIYNKSGNGLLCDVRQENGGTSGFRVNVDGIYLGEANQWQVPQLELRNKDSLRIYVEVTLPTASQSAPQQKEDFLTFTLQNGTEQKICLNAWAWNAELLHGLTVTKDTTISSATPIVIYDGLKVDSGAVLSIAAGTTLYFHNNAGVSVYGRLLCQGVAGNNVVMRGDRIDRMLGDLPYDRTPGQWQGIRFFPSSFGNRLLHADIHGTFNGVVADSSDLDKEKILISHSTIHNCQGVGLKVSHADASIINSQITNTLGDCVSIDGGIVDINSSTIAQFYPFDSGRGVAFHADVSKDLRRLHVNNSLITGYADRVVDLTISDSLADWRFSHSILRMQEPALADSTRFVDVVFENLKDTTTMGKSQFKLINIDKLIYDFHLKETSAAVDKADASTSPVDDHDGNVRDDKPDIGAYETDKHKAK